MGNISRRGVLLECHNRYTTLTQKEKDEICNGCGPAGWKGELVPETMWGLKVTEICNIHDFDYHIGQTMDDKKIADNRFLKNLCKYVKKLSPWYLVAQRLARCYLYYVVVKKAGNEYFKANKL